MNDPLEHIEKQIMNAIASTVVSGRTTGVFSGFYKDSDAHTTMENGFILWALTSSSIATSMFG
jgi:hypothetical protein